MPKVSLKGFILIDKETSKKLRKRYHKKSIKAIDNKIKRIKKQIKSEKNSPSVEPYEWWIATWEEEIKILEELKEELQNGKNG